MRTPVEVAGVQRGWRALWNVHDDIEFSHGGLVSHLFLPVTVKRNSKYKLLEDLAAARRDDFYFMLRMLIPVQTAMNAESEVSRCVPTCTSILSSLVCLISGSINLPILEPAFLS